MADLSPAAQPNWRAPMDDPSPVASSSPRFQEASAVLAARDLLIRLCDPAKTPRVPRPIRSEARALLRWFPSQDRAQALVDLYSSALLGGRQQ